MSNTKLTDTQVTTALQGLCGWKVVNGHLSRTFVLKDFRDAMAFMTRVAFEAEALNHHPNWSNVYNRVEVELWSHDLGGISEACAKLALAMNRAAGE